MELSKVAVVVFLLILLSIPSNPSIMAQSVSGKNVPSEVGDTAASVTFSISLGSKTFHAVIEGTELFREMSPVIEFSNTTFWGGERIIISFRHPDGRYVSNSYQGGVNNEGLALSIHEVPWLPMNAYDEYDDWLRYSYYPMNVCSTVEEVIDYHSTINYRIYGDCMPYQMHFTDSSGDAVVISGGDDGDPVFTRIQEHFLVSTNFNLNNPENRYGEYPCTRYQTCVDMLSDIQTEEQLTLEAVKDVLEEVCVPERSVYSYIYDATDRMFYLYFPHNFSQMVTFDIEKEVGVLGSEVVYNITELFENYTIPADSIAPTVTPYGDWSYSTPEQQGMDSEILQDMMNTLDRSNFCVDSVIVIRNGHIVFEDSLSGFGVTGVHPMYSVTKSVVSTLVGIAFDLGYLESLDQRLVDFFPERVIDNLDERKENITLRHLLTMTPGYDWDEWTYPYYDERNYCTQALNSADPIQFLLNLPMIAEPGTHWCYSSGATILLGAIMEKVTGMDLIAFARKYLFTPLGIGELYFGKSNGVVEAQGGLYLTARDAARFGYLILNNGSWNGEQIVSSEWIANATSAKIDITGLRSYDYMDNYGYKWWISTEEGFFCALGLDEQAILIHPGLDLMMVATANEDWIGWTKYFKGYVMRAVTGDPLPDTNTTTPGPPGPDMGLSIVVLSVSVVIVALVVLMMRRKPQ